MNFNIMDNNIWKLETILQLGLKLKELEINNWIKIRRDTLIIQFIESEKFKYLYSKYKTNTLNHFTTHSNCTNLFICSLLPFRLGQKFPKFPVFVFVYEIHRYVDIVNFKKYQLHYTLLFWSNILWNL